MDYANKFELKTKVKMISQINGNVKGKTCIFLWT